MQETMQKTKVSSRFVAMLAAMAMAWMPDTAAATWPNGKVVPVGYLGRYGVFEAYAMPGVSPSEFYFLYYSYGLSGNWSVQRMSTEGHTVWPGPARGLQANMDGYYDFGFAPDGTGGFLSFYYGSSAVRGERVDPAGTIVPPWLVDSPVSQQNVSIAAASADGGGAYLVWDHSGLRMLRVDPTGARLANWPAGGWLMSPTNNANDPPALESDGSGGVFVLWVNDRPRVIHVSGDTTVSPGWPAAGLPLQSIIEFAFSRRLLKSDETSFVALWLGYVSPGVRRLVCQRFSIDGHVEAGWPADGVEIRAGIPQSAWKEYMFRCFPDGAGGVTATWCENNVLYARHVLKNGSLATGYEAGARALFELRPPAPGGPRRSHAAVMSTEDGGLAVFYVDSLANIRARWFDADGNPNSVVWPFDAVIAYGADLRPTLYYPWKACMAQPDGSGGAYVLIEASGPEIGYEYPYAYAVHLVPVKWAGVEPRDPASIALAASPNPSSRSLTLRFTLPTSAPARLELLDLAGRRLRAMEVAGAGNHVERLEDLGALPPGVYLVRIAQGDRERLTRVAIVH